MRSIRSVIMKPPTTLVVAAQTAMNPRMVESLLCCGPSRDERSDERDAADRGSVPLMSGVWSSDGTREMTW